MKKEKFVVGVIFWTLILLCGCGKPASKEISVNDESDSIWDEAEIQDGTRFGNEADMSAESGEDSGVDVQNGNGYAFSTEYSIEDYCQGCFIVSKNDKLLYGMLGSNGEEILPVQYDDIDFINKEEVMDGRNEHIYAKTQYEDDYTIVNADGEQILSGIAEDTVSIDFRLDNGDADSPFFIERDRDGNYIKLYKEDGTLSLQFDGEGNDLYRMKCLSKDFYLLNRAEVNEDGSYWSFGWGDSIAEGTVKNTALYDRQGQLLQQWDGMWLFDGDIAEDGKCVFFMITDEQIGEADSEEGNAYQFTMDESGSISEDGEVELTEVNYMIHRNEKENQSQEDEYYLGKENDIRLYKSNDTWKLVDANDNPLYDERYYKCYADSYCYFLTNENDEMCLIDRNGNKIVDYGWITLGEDNIYFNGTEVRTSNFCVGDDGACFVQGNDVYMFMEVRVYDK